MSVGARGRFSAFDNFVSIQPQNVMFKNEGGSKIKLIDFSLSRKFDPGNEVRISFGTAEYVGEQIGDHCSTLRQGGFAYHPSLFRFLYDSTRGISHN